MPGFVIENVPSCTSSGLSFFARARSARSLMPRARPRKFFSSEFFSTGTINPQSSATAMPTLISRCRTIVVPSADALTVGKARSPSTQARTKNGMYVSLVPYLASKAAFERSRILAMRVMSASSIEYT